MSKFVIQGMLMALEVAVEKINELEPVIEKDLKAGKSAKEIMHDCLALILGKNS